MSDIVFSRESPPPTPEEKNVNESQSQATLISTVIKACKDVYRKFYTRTNSKRRYLDSR